MTTSTSNECTPDPRRKICVARFPWLLAVCVTALAFGSPEVHPGIRDPALAYLALAVGNSEYEHIRPYPAGKNDAEAVAQSLADIGFDVTKAVNLDRSEFVDWFDISGLPTCACAAEGPYFPLPDPLNPHADIGRTMQ